MLILSPKANDNLIAIADYIRSESKHEITSRTFINSLLHKCHSLADQPFQMGALRPELGEDIRSYPYGNYIIFFRYRQDALEVIMIVEGHRDIGALFTPN